MLQNSKLISNSLSNVIFNIIYLKINEKLYSINYILADLLHLVKIVLSFNIL